MAKEATRPQSVSASDRREKRDDSHETERTVPTEQSIKPPMKLPNWVPMLVQKPNGLDYKKVELVSYNQESNIFVVNYEKDEYDFHADDILEQRDEWGDSPLTWAAQLRDCALTQLLIYAGADVNAASKDGGTPLFWACKKGDSETAHVLLDGGANANVSREGETALLWAVKKNFHDLAVRLLKGGADPNFRAEDFGETSLCLAAQSGNLAMANDLLRFNANPNLVDEHGDSPLHEAAQQGYFNRKWGGSSPSSESSVELCSMLIDNGADVNLRNKDGDTPLHYAAKRGDANLAFFLLRQGASVDIPDNDGDTPLHWAAQRGDIGMAKLLCDHDADVNMLNETAESPLRSARERGDNQMTELLLEYDAPESDTASSFWDDQKPRSCSVASESFSGTSTPRSVANSEERKSSFRSAGQRNTMPVESEEAKIDTQVDKLSSLAPNHTSVDSMPGLTHTSTCETTDLECSIMKMSFLRPSKPLGVFGEQFSMK